MRIISGKYKGRLLISFKAEHIRPTTDRMKETIFNILIRDVPGQRALDLFAGTGNLGLEALSRGAQSIAFVESHRTSLKIIRENVALLKVQAKSEIYAQDVFKFLKSYKGAGFGLIMCDPPFTDKIAHQTMAALTQSACVTKGSVAVIESSKHDRIDDLYPAGEKGSFHLLDRRDFGDKSASFYEFK